MTEPFETSPPTTSASPDDKPQPETVAGFPWPPAAGSSIPTAFVDTWVQSVFRPASFFAVMPHRGFSAALAWFLPIAIISAALMLFWRGVLVALGYGEWVEMMDGQRFEPMNALVDFLFSPLTSTVYLLIAAGLAHIGLKLVGAASAPYMATLRATAFAVGAQLFVAVPLIGIPVAVLWVFVVTVIGLREVHHTTTGRAIAALLLPLILLGAFAVFVVVAGLLSLMALGGRP